jgi:Rps23 Pro-64 3,4-dihydroxylase Tpa1-like proline 4-hydroxylase
MSSNNPCDRGYITLAMTTSITSLLDDRIALPDSVENLARAFKTAKPFPHIQIDNMFSSSMLEKLVTEIPSITDSHWVYENNDQIQKYNLRSAVELGDTGFQLTAFLHSAAFLYFLSELTGIWELLPDPYLQGAGYHMMPRGGKFDVHADRNTAYETGLTRRLSLIIYLNKDWKPEYGGQFELWNSDATSREGVVQPLFNRTLIFEIADQNFHGVPNYVSCPKGQSRNSFLVYYHTVGVNGRPGAPCHSSIYAPSFYRKNSSRLRRLIRDVTPPLVLRTLKRVRDRSKPKGR